MKQTTTYDFPNAKSENAFGNLASPDTPTGKPAAWSNTVIEFPMKFNNLYIFEFKRDSSAKAAFAQIDENAYALPYAADKRKLFKIGVNFDSGTRTISEWEVE